MKLTYDGRGINDESGVRLFTGRDPILGRLIVLAFNSHDALIKVSEYAAELPCVASTEGKTGCTHCCAEEALAKAGAK